MTTKKSITLRELKKTEMSTIWPLIHQLNPDMGKAEFTMMLKQMVKDGFRVVAAFEGKKMLGLSGFWVGYKFYARKHLHIDNFVVDKDVRSKGVGKKLIDWMEALAKKEGCRQVVLDTYAHNTASHKFYCREDYFIAGYHFHKYMNK